MLVMLFVYGFFGNVNLFYGCLEEGEGGSVLYVGDFVIVVLLGGVDLLCVDQVVVFVCLYEIDLECYVLGVEGIFVMLCCVFMFGVIVQFELECEDIDDIIEVFLFIECFCVEGFCEGEMLVVCLCVICVFV